MSDGARLTDWLELGGFRIAQAIIWPMGPARAARFAEWMGRSVGARLWLTRRITDNLAQIRPSADAAERRRIVAGVMGNFTRTAIEYNDLPALCAAADTWRIEGLEHLSAARAAHGGRVVLASAHFGNWEAIRAVADRAEAPAAIIYHRFHNRLIDASWEKLITATGWPAFHKGRKGGIALYRHVAKGGAALILVDQRQGGAPLLDFLGRPAETSLAAAQLSMSAKAALVPAVAFRVGDGFHVRFEPAVPPSDPQTMMQTINDRIGAWVEEAPDQWFWLHRRWRVRPMKRGVRKGSGRS